MELTTQRISIRACDSALRVNTKACIQSFRAVLQVCQGGSNLSIKLGAVDLCDLTRPDSLPLVLVASGADIDTSPSVSNPALVANVDVWVQKVGEFLNASIEAEVVFMPGNEVMPVKLAPGSTWSGAGCSRGHSIYTTTGGAVQPSSVRSTAAVRNRHGKWFW